MTAERTLFSIDPVTQAALGRIGESQSCGCLAARTKKGQPGIPSMHLEAQNPLSQGWPDIEAYVDRCAQSDATVFEPLQDIPWDRWTTVITLPATIAALISVREIRLYRSPLRRLPPEIGRMTGVRSLDLYTSYSLHWLPYEIMRCPNIADSRISTRALYGNRNTGLPFPRLKGPVETLTPATCSVCDRGFGEHGPQLYWTTQRIGTDTVPLLAHTCSRDCLLSIPSAPKHYFAAPHRGGGGVGMPTPRY